MRNKHKWKNILPIIHCMRTSKKTHHPWQRLFNPKLHNISWTKSNTCQLTKNNEVIAETTEYQTSSRSSVSLKKNVKVPQRSCSVVDVNINTTENIKVEVIPNQLWLSAHPNICTYPMIADLKDRESNATTPFVIVNFSHHEHLHLPKDHVVAFTEKDCNEGTFRTFGIYV